jgi:hypothetical protein
MKHIINIREHLEAATDRNGHLTISAEINLDDLFDSIPEEDEIDVDIQELLAENRQIAHIWGVDDVQKLRPDLDDDQAWKVLQAVDDHLDCNVGITCESVEMVADDLYRNLFERRWQGRIDIRITDADGYDEDEVLTRLRDMADLLAKDMPGVSAKVDLGSVLLLNSDETASQYLAETGRA